MTEWAPFIASVVLMVLVVGTAIRWSLRNGLADRFRGRGQGHEAGGGGGGGGRD
jgi:hypothetical protein